MEAMEVTSFLPDDVLEEILVRLTVKQLLQLKCICKHWNALIQDYGFMKKHYHFQYAMHAAEHNDIPLLLDSHLDDSTNFFLLSKQQGVDSVSNLTPDFERDIPTTIFNDSELRSHAPYCMGVVNGVIGLYWPYFGYLKRLALWNPATREFKDVPQWPIMLESASIARKIGLGFDVQSNDIKILVRIEIHRIDYIYYKNECHLYSLKLNSWKRIEAPSYMLDLYYLKGDDCLNNGVYYWLAYDSSDHPMVIISFNFSTESYREIEVEPPWCLECRNSQQIRSDGGRVCCSRDITWGRIGNYKDSIALFSECTLKHTDCVLKISAVTKFSDDDNRVPLSWQVVLTLGPIHSYYGLWVGSYRLCGDILFVIQRQNSAEENLGCLYDPSTRTLNFLEVGFSSSFSYVESLFSLSVRSNI